MKITIKQAAKLLNKSDDFVRLAMDSKLLPIGTVVHSSPYRSNYCIVPEKLAHFMEIEMIELERRLECLQG